MSHPWLSWLHIVTALIAIAAGAFVLATRKGTRRHRRIGYFYVASMVALNVSSFFIFSLTGRFSPFHVASMLSLATVIAGFIPAWLRRPAGGWLFMHLQFMAWSYIGLLAAAASEAAVRIPQSPFWWSVLIASVSVCAVGGWILGRQRPGMLARYGRATG